MVSGYQETLKHSVDFDLIIVLLRFDHKETRDPYTIIWQDLYGKIVTAALFMTRGPVHK